MSYALMHGQLPPLIDWQTMVDNISRASRLFDRLTLIVALLGFSGLVVMAMLTFYDGAARYLGAPRVSGFADFGAIVFPVVIASCFPLGLQRGSNITIRLTGKYLGERNSRWLEFGANLVTLGFFSVLVWQLGSMASEYWHVGRTTPTVQIAVAPTWVTVTAIMALCVPVQAQVTIAWLFAALNRRPAPQHHESSDSPLRAGSKNSP